MEKTECRMNCAYETEHSFFCLSSQLTTHNIQVYFASNACVSNQDQKSSINSIHTGSGRGVVQKVLTLTLTGNNFFPNSATLSGNNLALQLIVLGTFSFYGKHIFNRRSYSSHGAI